LSALTGIQGFSRRTKARRYPQGPGGFWRGAVSNSLLDPRMQPPSLTATKMHHPAAFLESQPATPCRCRQVWQHRLGIGAEKIQQSNWMPIARLGEAVYAGNPVFFPTALFS